MILIGRYNHQALIKCGATVVRDEPDGNTYVQPEGLDISAYATHLETVKRGQHNAPIKAQIAALDLKRIRPLAEGDTAYLAKLNEQIVALRAQLK